MDHRVIFTTGQAITINEAVVQKILDKYPDDFIVTQEIILNVLGRSPIAYILPVHETPSGIAHRPTPDDLKYQQQKDKEEMMKDPKMILARAVKKDEMPEV